MTRLEWTLQDLADAGVGSIRAPASWRRALSSQRAQTAFSLGDIREAYIEVRTEGEDRQRVDLITRIPAPRRPEFEAAIAGLSESWNPIRRFCDAWRTPNSAIASLTELWLEFDDLRGADTAPSPHFGLVAKRQHLAGSVEAPDANTRQSVLSAALLLGMDERTVLDFVRRTGNVTAGGLIYVGAMTSRRPTAMKGYFCARLSDLERLLDELEVSAPGELRGLLDELLIEPLARGHVYVDVTFDAQGGALLGVVFPQQYIESGGDATRSALRQRLVTLGLLPPALSGCLAGWGSSEVLSSETSLGQLVQRFLDFKLVCAEPISIKAYLGIASYNKLLVGHD